MTREGIDQRGEFALRNKSRASQTASADICTGLLPSSSPAGQMIVRRLGVAYMTEITPAVFAKRRIPSDTLKQCCFFSEV